jgi:hypothetical protein
MLRKEFSSVEAMCENAAVHAGTGSRRKRKATEDAVITPIIQAIPPVIEQVEGGV